MGSLHSVAHSVDSMDIGGDDWNKQMYIETVYYKGNVVAMKEQKCKWERRQEGYIEELSTCFYSDTAL